VITLARVTAQRWRRSDGWGRCRGCCEPESVITPLDRVLAGPADAGGDVAADVSASALASMVLLIGDPWEPGGACQLSVELGRVRTRGTRPYGRRASAHDVLRRRGGTAPIAFMTGSRR